MLLSQFFLQFVFASKCPDEAIGMIASERISTVVPQT